MKRDLAGMGISLRGCVGGWIVGWVAITALLAPFLWNLKIGWPGFKIVWTVTAALALIGSVGFYWALTEEQI